VRRADIACGAERVGTYLVKEAAEEAYEEIKEDREEREARELQEIEPGQSHARAGD
jgi:hypothetical protein